MMMSLSHQELMGLADQPFGNYRLIKLIGRGGFADVYLAQQIYVHHYAVVKVLRGPLNQKARQRFQEEASMIMSLDHKHIVRVFDFGIQNGTPYLVMPWASNGSLRRMHPAGTKLPLPTVLRYAQQVADALTYLHRRNLVHHDIKPENMLLDADHNVLLGDFGLATMIDKTISQQSDDFVGTLAYTAPERFKNRSVPTPASDQYSLAVVIYEWLTGRRPFQGPAGHIMQMHLHASPLPLRHFVPDIPLQVESVILKALQKEPAQRFPSVQTFVDALRRAYESSLYPNVESTRTSSYSYRTSRTSSHRTSSDTWTRELEGLDMTLTVDLFIALLAGVTTYLMSNKEAAWAVFAFCTFIVPIVHAFARKSRLEKIVVFSTLLLSSVMGITRQNLFLAWILQFVLLAVFSVAASIYNFYKSPKYR